jgi:predicted esterase
MPRNALDARRFARRAAALVCAVITIVLLPIGVLRNGRAQAEGTPVLARAALALDASRRVNGAERPPALKAAESSAPKPHLVAPAPANRETRRTASGNEVIVYPPLLSSGVADQGSPVVMMLHGMCGDPLSICDFWSRAGREGSWLVCPGGNVTCGDARDWAGSGEVKAASIDESFAALVKAYGRAVARARGDILIGFSRGAFVARDVAYARPGRFRGLILLGAVIQPDPARLKASGVRRVVMAAGEHDMARPTMRRSAAAMSAAGLPSRYVSLGRIGHALPDNLEVILRDALRWIREAE